MPTYRQHVSFISSKPYSKWYVILYDASKVGSLYLSKQNEIGIWFIDDSFHDKLANYAVKQLIKKIPENVIWQMLVRLTKNYRVFLLILDLRR